MQRRRQRSPGGPLWLFALALLLRAAMPFLANASADLQGRALSEVCSVYGVALASHDPARHDAPVAPAADHAGDHCVLQALAALGPTDVPLHGLPPPPAGVVRVAPVAEAVRPPDLTATWIARRKHGPPEVA